MTLKKSLDEMKKERNESFLRFWYKITNIDNLGALFLFGCGGFILSWFTITLASDNNKIAAWFTTLLTTICIKFLMDKIAKMRETDKLESKGLSAVNNLDTILSNLLKVKESKQVKDIEYIEDFIINAITDWEDILPNLKYRENANQLKELNKQIKESKAKGDSENVTKLTLTMEKLIKDTIKTNLNSIPAYSGGTSTTHHY